jgi:hypothetical protein
MSGYGWKYKLIGPVAAGEVLDTMPAPGASNENCDLTKATMAVGNMELVEGEFTVGLADSTAGAEILSVTNNTEADWAEGVEVYVGVAGPDMSDVRSAAEANTAAIADHEARIAALEGGVAAQESEWVDDDEADDDDAPTKKKKGKK